MVPDLLGGQDFSGRKFPPHFPGVNVFATVMGGEGCDEHQLLDNVDDEQLVLAASALAEAGRVQVRRGARGGL
ncbi:MAG: hypothetical protein ACYCW6_30940 [Candidatus Xenobia bacterium]